jgi:hypothetical protein
LGLRPPKQQTSISAKLYTSRLLGGGILTCSVPPPFVLSKCLRGTMRLPTPSRGRERRGGGVYGTHSLPPFVVRDRLIVGGRISLTRDCHPFPCAWYAVGGRRVSYFARFSSSPLSLRVLGSWWVAGFVPTFLAALRPGFFVQKSVLPKK